MTTCLLVRHGQSLANVEGLLAGHLDSPLTEDGREQARRVAQALSPVPIRQIVTSTLGRCVETADELNGARAEPVAVSLDDRVAEVRYGDWTGRLLTELADEELWQVVQSAPSTVTFPASAEHASESMRDMASRVEAAWTDWDTRISVEHGDSAIWVLVSHGDVIKALLARALGLDLDAFQSIIVDPASVSIVHRRERHTAVGGMNLRDDVLARLAQVPADTDAPGGAGVVGGGNA